MNKKKDKLEIKWADEAKEQFQNCNDNLVNTILLLFLNHELPLSLYTYVSDLANGKLQYGTNYLE